MVPQFTRLHVDYTGGREAAAVLSRAYQRRVLQPVSRDVV